jgi:DNA-binding CsgD family transcriptional regulator
LDGFSKRDATPPRLGNIAQGMREQSASGGSRCRPIVGRARELEVFQTAFERMLTGRRQFVLIAGEPGIGKTHCAEALADMAEDRGALVLWGRCREEAGAPSYWPWVQILRAYLDASSLDEARLTMGGTTKDIAALVPELLESNPPPRPPPNGPIDASLTRFRTFDAIRQFLHHAADQVPLTLVLDDLHWADGSTLSLLEFLSQELLDSRLLIVATYREAEASPRSPLQSTLADITRDSEVSRVHLTGLTQHSISEMAERRCGIRLPEPAARMIYERTDGNPLFAIELIKVLIEEDLGNGRDTPLGKIPAGVREAVGRRLHRLSDRCNDFLAIAAVYGRQFAAGEIAAAADAEVQEVLSVVESAVHSGLVLSSADEPGIYQFTHALIREAIYEGLATIDRLRLHGRTADALVHLYSADPDSVVTRIAHHYHEASVLGNENKAVVYALLAADGAVRMCAYEDALAHYDRAIEILQRAGFRNDERVARAYTLKGAALYQLGRPQPAVEALREAVTRTSCARNAGMLVEALMLLAMCSRHVEQEPLVPLLERALALLAPIPSHARAQVLAMLAFSQRTLIDNSHLQHLVDDALAMARQCCDATARCACLLFTTMALRGNPENLPRRVLLGEEYIGVARSTGSTERLAEAFHWQALNYFESAQVEELDALLSEYESLSVSRFGLHQYQVGTHRVTLSMLRGDWEGLEERIERLLEIGTKTRRDDAAGVYGAQMFALNRDLGRLDALAPQVKNIASARSTRVWEPGLMLLCTELGLLAEARAIFDRLIDRSCLNRRDDMYLTRLVFCAETCCALGDARRAEALYQMLLPYACQTANHPTAVCFGVTDLYLAMLACTAGRSDLGRTHFEQALTLHRAMRAWPCLARTLFGYGVFLSTQETEEDRRRGFQQLRESEQLSRRLEMNRLVGQIDDILSAQDREATYPDQLTSREVEVLRLLSIGRTNKDVSLVLGISLNTVATHVRSILNKTNCANRTEAASYAIRHGLNEADLNDDTSRPTGRRPCRYS